MNHGTFTRRQGLSMAGLGLLGAALAACSTGTVESSGKSTTATSNDQFPVTIKHAHGSTTLDKPATRPATVAWSSEDICVGLGVLPVAKPNAQWGANANKSTTWFDEAAKKLGAEYGSEKYPAQYSDLDGIDFTAIAKASPDVIFALQSGMTKDEYDKLSKIAPVIPYLHTQWETNWQDAVTAIGKALGKRDEAATQIKDTKNLLRSLADKSPQIKGKSFISMALPQGNDSSLWIYSKNDPRSQFLQALGMSPAASAYPHDADPKTYLEPYSAEKAPDLVADVVVNWAANGEAAKKTLQDPLVRQIPAVRKGAVVNDPSAALNWAVTLNNPISIAWAAPKFVPEVAAAVDKSVS